MPRAVPAQGIARGAASLFTQLSHAGDSIPGRLKKEWNLIGNGVRAGNAKQGFAGTAMLVHALATFRWLWVQPKGLGNGIQFGRFSASDFLERPIPEHHPGTR